MPPPRAIGEGGVEGLRESLKGRKAAPLKSYKLHSTQREQLPSVHGAHDPSAHGAAVVAVAGVAASDLDDEDGDMSQFAPAEIAVSRTPAERPPVVLTSVFGETSVFCVGERVCVSVLPDESAEARAESPLV